MTKLDEDRREPDERDERQIGDQKRRSAVLAGDEGEPPDVPQSDCAADRGEDEPVRVAHVSRAHLCAGSKPRTP